MDKLPDNTILQFRHDTLEVVRKDVNMDKKIIEESLDLLQDWIKKQAHFVKKDFDRQYLERALLVCKGSLERTKQKLDKLCTYRTLMPEFFEIDDVKKEFESHKKYVELAILPKLTNEHLRVSIIRLMADDFDSHQVIKYYKYSILVNVSAITLQGEYLSRYDCLMGFFIVVDLRNVNPLKFATSMNPLDLRKALMLLTEGYSMRIKGIHLITSSKLVESVVVLFKQVLSAKIGDRIIVHKKLETLFDYIPKEILPVDFGGEEKPLKTLYDTWTDILASEENMEYFREMKNARTVESWRPDNQFSDKYMGTPGSFRALSVD